MRPIVEFHNNKVEIYDLTASTIQIDIQKNEEEDFILLNAGENGKVFFGEELLIATFEHHTLTLERTSEDINIIALYAIPIIKGESIITTPEVEMELIDDSVSTFTIGSGSSGVGSGIITASDINNLVTRVNNEAARRNKTGAVSTRAIANQAVKGEYMYANRDSSTTTKITWAGVDYPYEVRDNLDSSSGTSGTIYIPLKGGALNYAKLPKYHIGTIVAYGVHVGATAGDTVKAQYPADGELKRLTFDNSKSYSTGSYLYNGTGSNCEFAVDWTNWLGVKYSCAHNLRFEVIETNEGIKINWYVTRKSGAAHYIDPEIAFYVSLETYSLQTNTTTSASFRNVASPLITIKGASAITIPTAGSTKILATGQGSYAYLSQQTAVLAGYALDSTTTGCASSCTGLCKTACDVSCSNYCGQYCSDGCSGGCGIACASGSYGEGCEDCC